MSRNAPYSVIESATYSIAGDDENLLDSVVKITEDRLIEHKQQASRGCYDLKMGTFDARAPTCHTCGMDRKHDIGHFGVLESNDAIENMMFISEIRRWLRIICIDCGMFLFDTEKYKHISKDTRFAKALIEVSSKTDNTIKCLNPNCNRDQPKIVKDEYDHFTFIAQTIENGITMSNPISPNYIKDLFDRVSNNLVNFLGKKYHPRKLMLTKIPIPPNTIRPGVNIIFDDRGNATYHDLTNVLQHLTKQVLSNTSNTDPYAPNEHHQNTRQLYFDMVAGQSAQANTSTTTGKRNITVGRRQIVAISQGWVRKFGHIRGELMAGRTTQISRSTISGNPDLLINELGFPISFAKNIQISETVQKYNINRLNVYFMNGTKKYPGCSRVIKKNGTIHRISGNKRLIELQYGDIIERDVIDGDGLMLNRAPSLEKSAIAMHNAKVIEYDTIQKNVIVCALSNSDFDGDQLNAWPPHHIMSRVEAKYISGVDNLSISTKTSAPVMGQVQDSGIGTAQLSRCPKMNKLHAMRFVSGSKVKYPNFSFMDAEKSTINGSELLSHLFTLTPINYNRPSKWFKESLSQYIDYKQNETHTTIIQGKLVSGILDMGAVGTGVTGGIFHLIANQYGKMKSLDMMFALQRYALNYLDNSGFTIGLKDLMISDKHLQDTKNIISSMLTESNNVTKKLIDGKLIPPIGMNIHEYYEHMQKAVLQAPDDLLRPILSSINVETNGLYQMIGNKTKGSMPNLLHIIGCIGQVEIDGARIEESFSFRRNSVYGTRFSTDPADYGFVSNSYIRGMNVLETYNSGQNSRFDLINKALTTSVTGHANRKACMALQNVIVDNFRHAVVGRKIIQFIYGDDGLDTREVKPVKFRTIFMNNKELKENYHIDLTNTKISGINASNKDKYQKMFDDSYEQIKTDRDEFRTIYLQYENTSFSNKLSDIKQMAVDVKHVVDDAKISKKKSGQVTKQVDINELVKMYTTTEKFIQNLPYILINDIQERLQTKLPKHIKCSMFLMEILMRSEISYKQLLELNSSDLKFILMSIKYYYLKSVVEYAQGIGIHAAQSVAETLTQYMLDSHHRSVGGGTSRGGVVRSAEIFNAKTVDKEVTSEMLLRVLPEYENDRSEVLQIANQIEIMILKRFVSEWSLFYEPILNPVHPDYKNDITWIEEFKKYHPLIPIPSDLLNWCIRLKLNKESMVLKSISLELIVEKLRFKFPETYIINTFESAGSVIRIYFTNKLLTANTSKKDKIEELDKTNQIIRIVETIILELNIRGTKGIINADVVKINRHEVQPDGSLKLKNIYAIKTIGTNISEILYNTRIDPYTIISSSIDDNKQQYGISYANKIIIREIARFLGEKAPNYRHLMIYANQMTCTGVVTPIEKRGINEREYDNINLRISASAPGQDLRNAAINNETGIINGLSSSLINGQPPAIGTLYNDVIADDKFIKQHFNSLDSIFDDL